MKKYPDIMTVKQVAEYLQVDVQSIYKMAQKDKIPCTKIAGQWRFKKDILDEWLTKRIKKEEAKEIFDQPIKTEEQK